MRRSSAIVSSSSSICDAIVSTQPRRETAATHRRISSTFVRYLAATIPPSYGSPLVHITYALRVVFPRATQELHGDFRHVEGMSNEEVESVATR